MHIVDRELNKLHAGPSAQNPAIVLLESMGYTVELVPSEDESSLGMWYARSPGVLLSAPSALEVLGLAALWKEKVLSPAKDRFNEILDAAFDEDKPRRR